MRGLARICVGVCVAAVVLCAADGMAERPFKQVVGEVAVGNVTVTTPLSVPFITWGGDAATFYANGGLDTKPDTIFGKLGFNLKLTPGDDFVQQVRDYMAGKSPFLRGTFHMIGLASEVIGADPRTKGVVVVQLTFSVGDHMVSRANIKLNDIKGKTIVLQECGPHVGMLDDVLKTAKLTWDDIKVVWAKDLTGTPDSPAEIFRKREDVAACFVISPDMNGLTGGLRKTGSGAEGTVKGAHVLISTEQMSRSIADVYVCRKDFYDTNKDWVAKFVAGYLKGCEDIVEMKKAYESKGSDSYMAVLKLMQDIYGAQVIPTLEGDAHGLISDCSFVGYPGNVAFFTEKGNLSGFEAFQNSALKLATSRGYAAQRVDLLPSGFDYGAAPFTGGYLTKTATTKSEHFKAEALATDFEKANTEGALDERTMLSFTIGFEPNENVFSPEKYGADFQRVVEMTSKFGNAVVLIRGHADPSLTLIELTKAGMATGALKQAGSSGNFTYSLNGKPLDLTQTTNVIKLIEDGKFDGVAEHNPRETMQSALKLSTLRAEAVRDSISQYASEKGLKFDKSQIVPQGVGVREPFIAKPKDAAEAKQNMRVEFRLMRVNAEATKAADFNY